ncbi:hypothetical protein TI39_contig474g00001 [Zymoseptoria brevis]|uniref:Uncharacterized protein n=1 Tax=Zymoseptoria brevis TaxID=1047168 RepID=A0A0F4GN98_9PEZI|nr:hypothetical protein TI39_contig474g00001 [Zymoseptoria brevis]
MRSVILLTVAIWTAYVAGQGNCWYDATPCYGRPNGGCIWYCEVENVGKTGRSKGYCYELKDQPGHYGEEAKRDANRRQLAESTTKEQAELAAMRHELNAMRSAALTVQDVGPSTLATLVGGKFAKEAAALTAATDAAKKSDSGDTSSQSASQCSLARQDTSSGKFYYCKQDEPGIIVSQQHTQSALSSDSSSDEGEYDSIIASRINRTKNRRLQYKVVGPARKLGRWVGDKKVSREMLEEWEDLAISDSDFDSDGSLTGAGNPYLHALTIGYWSLSRELYNPVKSHTAATYLPDANTWEHVCQEILTKVPFSALLGICGAGLQRMKKADPKLAETLQRYRDRSAKRPCIYIIEFADEDGVGPKVGELRSMVSMATAYAWPDDDDSDAHDLAIRIDSVEGRLSSLKQKDIRSNGTSRQYLSDGAKDNSRKRFKVMLAAVLKRLDALNLSDSAKCPFLLNDAGYTNNGVYRIEDQHLRHISSNDLMNLFEAISIAELGGRYRMYGEVVFLCYSKEEASLGEIVFSLLAESYVESGRGFNGKPAGENMGSRRSSTNDGPHDHNCRPHIRYPCLGRSQSARRRI